MTLPSPDPLSRVRWGEEALLIGTTLWLATVGRPASLLMWRLCLSFPLTDRCLLEWCRLSPGHRHTTPVAPGATPPSASPQGWAGTRWHTSESTCNLSQQVSLRPQQVTMLPHQVSIVSLRLEMDVWTAVVSETSASWSSCMFSLLARPASARDRCICGHRAPMSLGKGAAAGGPCAWGLREMKPMSSSTSPPGVAATTRSAGGGVRTLWP